MRGFSVRAVIVILAAMSVLMIPLAATWAEEGTKPTNVAIVNGKQITHGEFDREFEIYKRRLKSQGADLPEQYVSQARSEVLKELIDRELVFQESQKKGIKVKPEEVDKEIVMIKQRYKEPKQFETILAQMNLTEETLRSQIADRAAIRNLVNQEIANKITISETDSKAFYDSHPDLFKKPEEVHARHILIKVDANADDKTRAEARKTIEAIKKRADGGEDFAELAKSTSQCPSAPNGGDLGFFSKGKMVPPFETAAFALKDKQISDIVQTDFGFHVIQVLERHEAKTVGYDEVKARIADNLSNEQIQQKLQTHIEELRKTAKIETFLK